MGPPCSALPSLVTQGGSSEGRGRPKPPGRAATVSVRPVVRWPRCRACATGRQAAPSAAAAAPASSPPHAAGEYAAWRAPAPPLPPRACAGRQQPS